MRTNCEQARERFSRLLDDELSTHELVLLEQHLGACSACAAFVSDVGAYTSLLRATPLEPAPQVWQVRRLAARRLAARVAAVTAAAAAAVLMAVSTVPLNRSAGRAPVGFGYWPTGLVVHPTGDGNLGVQHTAFQRRSADGPRRGVRSA